MQWSWDGSRMAAPCVFLTDMTQAQGGFLATMTHPCGEGGMVRVLEVGWRLEGSLAPRRGWPRKRRRRGRAHGAERPRDRRRLRRS